jgi:aminoglycoside/choline kinase family phosphotransferase
MPDRNCLKKRFLADAGWGACTVTPMAQDASFRHYSRITGNGKSALLMDAPPEHEDIRPFIAVSEHLARLGIRCPNIYQADVDSGFLLLEDLGMDTFTKLLYDGHNELSLYHKARSVLVKLHNHVDATRIALPRFGSDAQLDEISLFTDWYLPAVRGRTTGSDEKLQLVNTWKSISDLLPDIDATLVLRDFHVDNLMMVNGDCAVLDYQDALLGSPAYDLVSLLEDARRDIPAGIRDESVDSYLQSCPGLGRDEFLAHIAFWGAQRHFKVAGIFTRLWLRDDKPDYLDHLPRVMKLLARNLQHPLMQPLLHWFAQCEIDLRHADFDRSRDQIRASGLIAI